MNSRKAKEIKKLFSGDVKTDPVQRRAYRALKSIYDSTPSNHKHLALQGFKDFFVSSPY